MFESANLKHHLDKALYKREAAKLRQALLDAQYDLKQHGRCRPRAGSASFSVPGTPCRSSGASSGRSARANSRAPWTLVEANNKYHARIKVLKTMCRALEDALDRAGKSSAGKRGKKKK